MDNTNGLRELVKEVFSLIRRASVVGGNGGPQLPMYGEFTEESMFKSVGRLLFQLRMIDPDVSMKIVDIGAGLGKPTMCASLFPETEISIGIEVAPIRYMVRDGL